MWFSHTQAHDRLLVLAESAIDALSYAALFPDAEDQTRYASVSGQLSSKQRCLIRAALERMPQGAEIVTAFDADEMGHRLVHAIREAVEHPCGERARNFTLKVHPPTGRGKDWNEVLQRVVTKECGSKL